MPGASITATQILPSLPNESELRVTSRRPASLSGPESSIRASSSRELVTLITMAFPPGSNRRRKFSLGKSAESTGNLVASTTMSSAKKSGSTTKRQGASTLRAATGGVELDGSVRTNNCPISSA